MSSATNFIAALLVAAAACCAAEPLRVCSDPNNLPYSNEQRQGFENKIAELIGQDLGREVVYTWYPQRSKFFKATLNSGVCDVVIGVPAGFEEASSTQPYYRSTYVFVSRADRKLQISSLDDPRLRTLKIGVHVLGDEKDALPPVQALINRGIVTNLVGVSIFGHLEETDPAADVLRAVENGTVDLAIAWGPLAGYFARTSRVPLEVTPIPGDAENPGLPLHFDIGMGVRASDTALKATLDRELVRRQAEIQEILREYGVPQLPLVPATAAPVWAKSGGQG
ncbi:MAG: quinoprotein dehydrogenase-associated putative ABC transporter substrate-binding protein [Terracidiphilus sp.]